MNLKSELKIIVAFLVLFANLSWAQTYAPMVGQPGTSAMHKDSVAFINWAKACKIQRGFQDLSNTSLGFASVGDSSMATGKAQSNGVVSLGDRGSAICTFEKPIMDGPGYDFAVFENSFDDTFLELAFVEVSSDGINFTRFPAHSLSDTMQQTASFGPTDATKINNLAGKYRGGYGTPFDLSELAGKPNLDISAITHIKIADVVGSVNSIYATRDNFGNKVNDPWPTGFPSSGFDLDAVGVIHETSSTSIEKQDEEKYLSVHPNPVSQHGVLKISSFSALVLVKVLDCNGRLVMSGNERELNMSGIEKGLYIISIQTVNGIVVQKMIVF